MRRAALSYVACPAVHYFSTLSHKRPIFKEEDTEYKMRVLVSEKFVIPRRIQRDLIISVHGSPCKVSFILVRF